MAALGAHASDALALATYSARGRGLVSDAVALVSIAPPSAGNSRSSDAIALVTYAANPPGGPRVSDAVALVTYSTALPLQNQSLAWTFTLDGHTFYCLDLGEQGTFLYDFVTQQWCEFQTQNSVGWNLRNGTMWYTLGAPRVVGGDSTGPYVWELDPTALFDDQFRDIEHAATAGLMLRSRVYRSLSELRIATSAGIIDDTTGAAYMQLTYSDDGGQTYSAPLIVYLETGSTVDGQQDIRFSSLGSFMAPGRVFQLSDVGGVLRLDGVDAMIDAYDGEDTPQSEQG